MGTAPLYVNTTAISYILFFMGTLGSRFGCYEENCDGHIYKSIWAPVFHVSWGKCLEVELMDHGLDLFYLLRSCFQRGHPVLQAHWQCLSPAASQPGKHARALSVSLIVATPVGLKKYLIMLLLAFS